MTIGTASITDSLANLPNSPGKHPPSLSAPRPHPIQKSHQPPSQSLLAPAQQQSHFSVNAEFRVDMAPF